MSNSIKPPSRDEYLRRLFIQYETFSEDFYIKWQDCIRFGIPAYRAPNKLSYRYDISDQDLSELLTFTNKFFNR
jgi:hypothetical protein